MTITIASSIAEIVTLGSPKTLNGGSADAAGGVDDSKPILVIDDGNLPKVAEELRDIFAKSNLFFDRGGPARIVLLAGERVQMAERLDKDGVVRMAHKLCRPAKAAADGIIYKTLPDRVANLYLNMSGEWHLLPLASISTAPILAADGTVQAVEGYQPATRVYCCNLPKLDLPARPTRAEAEAALITLRTAFRTFPFADAARRAEDGVEVVDHDQPAGYDESAFICALLTAICRQSLWLAPGLLLYAPSISGAGTGKGKLVRAIAMIAYGMLPRPFTPGNDRHEMDKRLVAEVIQGNPIVYMDNINGMTLRSDTLASFLTERPSQVRILGRSQMVQLESASFFCLTGNGLVLSEDLARRFVCCELDARCEDPEQRPFPPGFLGDIERRRAELLAAGLTILRWGRQNASTIKRGKALGSFEDWSIWVRDPLVALGCRDPIDRINELKARDPERQKIIGLFNAWFEAHGDGPVKVVDLAEPVRAIADPNNRGRQYLARAIVALAGTRLAGFVLERLEVSNSRKEGSKYRLRVLGDDQKSSASSASSAEHALSNGKDSGNFSADAPVGGLEAFGGAFAFGCSNEMNASSGLKGVGADDADAFQANVRACDHCGKAGELIEGASGGVSFHLHRECLPAWEDEHR